MKKRKLLAGILATSSLFMLGACDMSNNPTPTPTPSQIEEIPMPIFDDNDVVQMNDLVNKILVNPSDLSLIEKLNCFTYKLYGFSDEEYKEFLKFNENYVE